MALDARAVRYTTLPITSVEPIRLNFPAGLYMVTPPVVLVTVDGGPTHVSIVKAPVSVPGYGEVYAHVDLIFPASLVGLHAHVAVLGQGF